MVFDFDDVLVDFSWAMYCYIKLNWLEYSRYFYDPEVLNNEELMKRPLYNINEWLILKKYENIESGQYSALQIEIFGKIINGFFKSDSTR